MGVVSNLMTLVLILIAGLMGASGVVLAAAAAHAKSGMGLDGAVRQHTPSLAWDLMAPVISCCSTLSQFSVESRYYSRVC